MGRDGKMVPAGSWRISMTSANSISDEIKRRACGGHYGKLQASASLRADCCRNPDEAVQGALCGTGEAPHNVNSIEDLAGGMTEMGYIGEHFTLNQRGRLGTPVQPCFTCALNS